MPGGELLPDVVQEFKVFLFRDAADEREAHLARGLCRFSAAAELFPHALSAQVGREFFEREPARQDLHPAFGNLELRSENVCVILAGAHDGLCHAVECLHEPEHEVVHPFRLHERARVGGHVGAVVAEYLDARDLRAEAYEPGAGARRLEFDEVDGVALEQAQYGAYARDGEFAVRVPELFHAEQARKQDAVAVLDDTAGARVEGASRKEGLHAVGAHVRNHVPQVVRDAVCLVQVVGVEKDAYIVGGAVLAFLLQVKAQLQELGNVHEERPEYDGRNHSGAEVSGRLVLEAEHLPEGARDGTPEDMGARIQDVRYLEFRSASLLVVHDGEIYEVFRYLVKCRRLLS